MEKFYSDPEGNNLDSRMHDFSGNESGSGFQDFPLPHCRDLRFHGEDELYRLCLVPLLRTEHKTVVPGSSRIDYHTQNSGAPFGFHQIPPKGSKIGLLTNEAQNRGKNI